MKKFLLAVTALFCSMSSFAQVAAGEFSVDETSIYYGVRLGGNISYISGDQETLSSKGGWTFGGVLGIRVSDVTPLFIESGLYFTQLGAKKDRDEINLDYLEIPVLLKAGFEIEDDIAVLPFIGPVFSLGVGGKTKGYYEDATNTRTFHSVSSYSNRSIEGNSNTFLRQEYLRPDVGLKLGCGAEWNMLYVEIGYRFGIANILNSNEFSQHNNALYANVGVNF